MSYYVKDKMRNENKMDRHPQKLVCPSSKHLRRAYCIPGLVLGTGDIAENKADVTLSPRCSHSFQETHSKYMVGERLSNKEEGRQSKGMGQVL